MRLEAPRLWVLLEDIRRTGAVLLRNSAADMGGWILCGVDPVFTESARTSASHGEAMEENLRSLAENAPAGDAFRLLMSHHPFRCASMADEGYVSSSAATPTAVSAACPSSGT